MKILIADDHPIVLQGIDSFLNSKKYNVVCACCNGIEAWNAILAYKPDVAILDHSMPGLNGVEVAEKVIHNRLPTKIVLLTMHKEKTLLDKAMAVGIKGYLLKDLALGELEQCLQTVSAGEVYHSKQLERYITIEESTEATIEINKLTHAEQKILRVIADGKTSAEIAELFFISVKTVEKHRSNIIKKLDLPQTANSIAIWAAKNLK